MTLGSTYSSDACHLSLRHPRRMVRTLKQVYWPYGVIRSSLGSVGQVLIAFLKGRYALSSAQRPLEAWQAPHCADALLPSAKAASLARLYPFEKDGRAAEQAMAQAGGEAAQVVDLHGATQPLRGRDMLPSYLVYWALRHWAARRQQTIPSVSGISLTGLLVRDYASYPADGRLRRVGRRALRLFGLKR